MTVPVAIYLQADLFLQQLRLPGLIEIYGKTPIDVRGTKSTVKVLKDQADEIFIIKKKLMVNYIILQ